MVGGQVSIGRTSGAYVLRLVGRCTMAESPAAHAFADGALAGGEDALYVDLSQCTYLDSTFLGSLLDLHRRHGKSPAARFRIVAPQPVRARLFEPMQLHKLFHFADQSPGPVDAWVDLRCTVADEPGNVARHVMECHRRLAEIEGPHQRAFAAIAQQLERELTHGR